MNWRKRRTIVNRIYKSATIGLLIISILLLAAVLLAPIWAQVERPTVWSANGSPEISVDVPNVPSIRSVYLFRRVAGAELWEPYCAEDVVPGETHVFDVEDLPEGKTEWAAIVVDVFGRRSVCDIDDLTQPVVSIPSSSVSEQWLHVILQVPPPCKPVIVGSDIPGDMDGDGLVRATDLQLLINKLLGV